MSNAMHRLSALPLGTAADVQSGSRGSDALTFGSSYNENWLSSDITTNDGESLLEQIVSNTSRFAGMAAFVLTVAALTCWIF